MSSFTLRANNDDWLAELRRKLRVLGMDESLATQGVETIGERLGVLHTEYKSHVEIMEEVDTMLDDLILQQRETAIPVEKRLENIESRLPTPAVDYGDISDDKWSKLTKNGSALVRYLLTCSNWESTITNAMKVMGKQASSARDTKSFDKAVQRTNNDLLEHYPAYEIERPQRSKSIRLVKSA